MNDGVFSVAGKVIVVTGAFGLIGRVVCDAYLRNQARVVVAGHNSARIPGVQEELAAVFAADDFLVCSLDVTSKVSVDACLAQTVARFGRVDVLVNNAAIDAKFDQEHRGRNDSSRFEDYPIELIRDSLEVNLLGAVRMAQAACKQMRRQGGGNIINVASTYALISPNQNLYDFGDDEVNYKPVDYVVSKSFMPNFTRYLATFYARENIRCNAIAPHGVFAGHEERFLGNFSRLSPIGRMCEKSELEGPFLFLASEASSYMTGAVLVVDGGWTAW